MKFSLKNKRVLGQLVISTLEQNFRPLPLTFGDLIQPEGQPPFSHPNVNAACQWLSPKPRTAVQLVSVPLLNLKEWLTTIAMTVVTYVVVHCSAIRLCPTLRDPMDCSTPGFPVLHHLPEFTQTHVHWVGVAIQPSHSLSWMKTPYHGIQDQQFSWQILLLSPLDRIVQSLYFYVCKTQNPCLRWWFQAVSNNEDREG